jgi:hypothetical protein
MGSVLAEIRDGARTSRSMEGGDWEEDKRGTVTF